MNEWKERQQKIAREDIERLEALGRTRSLDERESLILERALCSVDGRRQPTGLNRALARLGIGKSSRS